MKVYDPDGNVYKGTFAEVWKQFAKDEALPEKRIVKTEILPNGITVSTAWTPFGSSFVGSPELQELENKEQLKLYETMAFDKIFGGTIYARVTYPTRKAAEEGHELVKAKLLGHKNK